jgi:UDP-N-acetylmuramoyl-L-alanyl-D-glutamate--2,6-diaminopimelate ligase
MFKKIIHFFLAWLAYWRYGRPARKLIVVGVTGTKGKTTTSRLIASVLEAGGNKVGLLSTVEFQVGDKRWLNDKKMTMLGRGENQRMLREMVRAGCKYAVVETSSWGIVQYRHYGLQYDIVVFTNLGTEHNEQHGGFENLRRDKGKIFAQLMDTKHKIINGIKVPKVIIANIDDKNADYYLQFRADEKLGFSVIPATSENPDNSTERWIPNQVGNDKRLVSGKNITSDNGGVNFEADGCKFKLNIIGEFNVCNALAAIAVGKSQKISIENIAKGLASVKLVEGRMESVEAGQNFKVIVDYAHEPMSFTELFLSLRKMVGDNKKIIAVVGSDGGGRDKGKREKMGEITGRLADITVISDVNCYDEDPVEIAEMLAKGARQAGRKDGLDLFVITDRRQGIAKAISLANASDVVVITAKGTEPYIGVANGKKIPWDDRRVAREILEEKI